MEPLDVLALTVYSVTMALGLPSNLLSLSAFLRKLRRKPTPCSVYMFNLALSDLTLAAFLPLKMAEAAAGGLWLAPPSLCPLSEGVHFVAVYGSGLFLAALSAGRYLSVAYPIRYSLLKRPRNSWLVSLGLWLLVLAHLSVVLLAGGGGGGGGAPLVGFSRPHNATVCYRNLTAAQLRVILPLRLELCLLLFLLPLALSAYCYLGLIWVLRRSGLRPRLRRRVVRTALATLAVYAVAFGPYNVSHVVGFVQGRSVGWRREALLLSALNTVLNPLVLFCSSAAVEKAFHGWWEGLAGLLRGAWVTLSSSISSISSSSSSSSTRF